MVAHSIMAGARGLATVARSTSSGSAARGGLVAIVYVSEGRNTQKLNLLETTAREACEKHGARVVNVFRDAEYNRTGFTLGMKQRHPADQEDGVSGVVEPLRQSAMALTERALSLLDLRTHSATHPRCGVVDHISCHAIGESNDSIAVNLARCLGEGIGEHLSVPVLLYGLASPAGVQLADLRRKYGYFRETAATDKDQGGGGCGGGGGGGGGGWAGAHVIEGGLVEADYGPPEVSQEAGIVMLGATPWVCNYNVPVSVKLSSCPNVNDVMKAARRVARKVSERGGGLPAVQAMALPHGGEADEGLMTVEIACNLLDVSVTGPEAVQAEVDRLCRSESQSQSAAATAAADCQRIQWAVGSGYVTNMTTDGIMIELD